MLTSYTFFSLNKKIQILGKEQIKVIYKSPDALWWRQPFKKRIESWMGLVCNIFFSCNIMARIIHTNVYHE